MAPGEGGHHAHRHVAVSTIITAIARRTLYDLANECITQGCPAYYCDSITGDRTVVLRSPEGRVIVGSHRGGMGQEIKGGDCLQGDKRVLRLGSWVCALSRDASGREGWFPLLRLIRHKAIKDIHLISSKRGRCPSRRIIPSWCRGGGQSGSLLTGDCSSTQSQPLFRVVNRIDLLDHVKDFSSGGRDRRSSWRQDEHRFVLTRMRTDKVHQFACLNSEV